MLEDQETTSWGKFIGITIAIAVVAILLIVAFRPDQQETVELPPLDDANNSQISPFDVERTFTDSELGLETAPEGSKNEILANLGSEFTFYVVRPDHWRVDFIPFFEAINFADPTIPIERVLDRPQVYIFKYRAEDFSPDPRLGIFHMQEVKVDGHEARWYNAIRNLDSLPFDSQPDWRNDEDHSMMHIRVSEDDDLYVALAFSPELSGDFRFDFIEAIKFFDPADFPESE